jgi:O-antigen/teichoic acid export membrane protein
VTQRAAESEPARPPLAASVLAAYGTNLAVAVLSLVNVLITARALGPSGRGEVAFLTTVAFLTAQLAAMGIHQANINFAGRDPALRPALVVNSLVLSLLCGGAAAVGVAAVVIVFPAVGAAASGQLLALALASVPVMILQLALQQLAVADYRFRASNGAWLLVPLVACVVNGTLALAGVLSVGAAVGAWVGGQVLATLVLWRAVRHPLRRPDPALARRMLAFGLQTHAGRVMLFGSYRLDQWILGAVAGPRELGLYSVAVAWAEVLFFLPTALATVQRPDLVRADRPSAARQAARAFRPAVLFTAALTLAIVVLAPLLCVGFFGEPFRESVGQVRILALGAFGIVALKLLGATLTAQRMPLRETAAIAFAFVAIVALDAVLIPAHGGTGAAIASTVAYTAGGIAVVAIFARSLPTRARSLIPRPSDVPDALHQASMLAGRLARPRRAD